MYRQTENIMPTRTHRMGRQGTKMLTDITV